MRTRLLHIWNFLVDLIFLPSAEDLELRSLSHGDIFVKLPQAPVPPFPFITSLFAYKNKLVSTLIWNIKYKKDQHAIALGGYALHTKLREMNLKNTILVPIPISKKRRNERGYNQCELLVDEIIKLDEEKIFRKNFDLLVRTKHMGRQTLKNRKERLESTESIFSIGRNLESKEVQIIVIDDVTTTGSTLREARDVLLRNGYTNVRALTLAH